MQGYSADAAKAIFSQLVEAAASGKKILIIKEAPCGRPLVTTKAPKRRGMLAGVMFDAEASDALDVEVARLFEAPDPTKCRVMTCCPETHDQVVGENYLERVGYFENIWLCRC